MFYIVVYLVPPHVVEDSSSANVVATEGDTVVLTCNVTGVPPPEVTWYRSAESTSSTHQLIMLHQYY